ncbi:MAG: DUF819 family protein [Bacteroidota bacterium]
MVSLVLLAIFYFIFPAIVLLLCQKFIFFKRVGAVICCYIAGIIIGNSGFLTPNYRDLLELFSGITIIIALPLLLFTLDIRKWKKMARKTFISLIIGVSCVIVILLFQYFLWINEFEDAWKLIGLLVGVYSGGTPNLAAIKEALQVDDSIYIMVHTVDLFISAIYLFFLMTVGIWFFRKLLPNYRKVDKEELEEKQFENYLSLLKKENRMKILVSLGLSLFLMGLGLVFHHFLPGSFAMAGLILFITSSGILFSYFPFTKKLEVSFDLGMYFVLIFSLSVASLAEINEIISSPVSIIFFVAFTVFGSLFLNILFARLFKIDSDTTLITSVALICSPPFVPLMAGAMKNREIIIPGITIGVIGFAIGNYLGIFFAYLLKQGF